MARPIWSGTLSFGLLNIPISLMSGEKRTDIHFRMLDARNNAAVRYERVNAETGEEVPWKEIVKAYEYDKGNYVVLEPDDIKSAAAEGREAVEIEAFVDAASIGPQYFEKPYVLVPGKKAEKGYVLLRETLKRTGKIGISRVVIRTREYLSAVMPQGDALVLLIMRYPQELVDVTDYKIPEGNPSDYRVTPKELQMAEQLIDSMSGEWAPDEYRDEFRDRLHKVIEKRLKQKGVVTPEEDERDEVEESTNVVDFMALLQQSLATNKRTPARKSAAAPAARKKAAKKTTKAEARAPAKKSTAKKSARKTTAARKAG